MPSFKPTDLWDAEPHTLAKIEIVRRYLYLWFFILGTTTNRLVYIDGFAGPGGYKNSNDSSPLAALGAAKAALERLSPSNVRREWSFYFIEKDPAFASDLTSVISDTSWPAEFTCEVQQGPFDQKLKGIIEKVKKLPSGIPPTFAFIDPFGATGVPFSHVAEILKHRSCEVLINLDSDGIGRLVAAQSIEKNKE